MLNIILVVNLHIPFFSIAYILGSIALMLRCNKIYFSSFNHHNVFVAYHSTLLCGLHCLVQKIYLVAYHSKSILLSQINVCAYWSESLACDPSTHEHTLHITHKIMHIDNKYRIFFIVSGKEMLGERSKKLGHELNKKKKLGHLSYSQCWLSRFSALYIFRTRGSNTMLTLAVSISYII
jgi:hypothetical protein